MQLKLFKYQGAGNDFVAFDNRDGKAPDGEDRANLVRALCDRRRGLGGDGVLVVESPRSNGDFRMRYYNADGGEGEMCGNGARCIAAFAVVLGAAGREMAFETGAGLHHAHLMADGGVELALPDVDALPRHVAPEATGRTWDVDFLVVGVPHAAVWVNDVKAVDVENSGRALRRHDVFKPAGANINFAQNAGRDRILVRTYERGVEAETLACGTGSTAAAICHARRMDLSGRQRITVIPTGGEALSIGFELTPRGARAVTLAGPAKLVYSTAVDVKADGSILPA